MLLTGLRDEAGLSPFGVLSDHTVVSGLLRSRLLIQDLVDRHPEILEIPITAPIVIGILFISISLRLRKCRSA